MYTGAIARCTPRARHERREHHERPRIPVREARKQISTILASGKTVAVGDKYGHVRGFIVGVPEHNHYNGPERRKALRAARTAFLAALDAEKGN